MIENLTAAFQLFTTIDNVAVLFIGVVIGTTVGAIPGMTSTMGVALTLPFTFYL